MGMMINRRRVCGGKSLPYDAEIEYLESTGTQYIDTGYQINYKGSVALEHQATIAYTVTNVRQLNGSNGYGFWGCAANNRFECAGPRYPSNISVGTAYHDILFSFKYENGQRHNKLYIDNVEAIVNNYVMEAGQSYDYDIFIFAIGGRNNAAALFFSKAKIKSYKLLFDSVAVRDYIPVRKGQVGYLYDKVSGQLFGNAGTGQFILGPDKN